MRAVHVSAMANKTRCRQLRYSLQFATSIMAVLEVHTCQFAAKVPNGRGI